MRIGIMTAAGQGNLGDELILREELGWLRKRYPGAAFSVFTYGAAPHLLDRVADVEFVEYFPHALRRRPFRNVALAWKNLSAIRSLDLLVVGGGGIFFEKENGRPSRAMWQWALRVGLAKFSNVPVAYFALGCSLDDAGFRRWKWLFSGKNIHVSVRELDAQRKLAALGIPATLTPDPVFLGSRPSPRGGSGRVGLALRSGMLPREAESVDEMVAYLKGRGLEPVMLCHSAHPDDPASDDASFLEVFARRHGLAVARTNAEALECYPYLDYVVAMRLHSAILSVRYGVPFVMLSYSGKTDALMSALRWPHWMPAQGFSVRAFSRKFEDLEGRRAAALLDLGVAADRMRSAAEQALTSTFSHVGQN